MTTRPQAPKSVDHFRPSFKSDWVRALQRTASVNLHSARTLAAVVDEMAAERPDRPALTGEETALTYGELAGLSRRYSRWAVDRGLRKGDRVALLMDNDPNYVAIWIGLSRIGIVVALLNPRLIGASLLHCIEIAGAGRLIVDADHVRTLREALGPTPNFPIHVHGSIRDAGLGDYDAIDDAVSRISAHPLSDEEVERPMLSDIALLIYTSGTTGMPKAAFVSHYRIVMWSEWFAGMIDAETGDRFYNCLPMCHSVGGVVGVGSALVAGASIIVRRDFSASKFWEDVNASQATIFLYVGELCRYLLSSHRGIDTPRHRLRLCIGNGLRSDIWQSFAKTFEIPRIIEFYAATEGSFSLFNVEGKPGAAGRVPPFMAHRSPVALVKFDFGTDQPFRDAKGRCLRCAPNEIGEAIGKVEAQPFQLSTRFEGYVNKDETERKILRNVFAEGDTWFRTGDLMKLDASGYYYFIDRVGDTFRWKGENVSTSEVAAILGAAPGVLQASVYGVAMPHSDGRAGMAALVVSADFDLAALRRHVHAHLASYARPLFLRVCDSLAVTGTFKPSKSEYVREGYDPALTQDRLFFDDDRQDAYRPIDQAVFSEIASGGLFDRNFAS